MFSCTIFIWPCDVDLQNFDLGGVCRIKSLIRPMYLPIVSILRLSVSELCVTQSDHITITWNRHCACAVVTYYRGGNDPHFWNPWPQFTYSLGHFQGATTKLHLSHCLAYKVHCACAVSRDLCIGGPPKPHVTIFWPRIAYLLYNFYGATRWIQGSFILEHPHVNVIFGQKQTVQSKLVPKMAVFRKFKGINIKYSYRGPQKALPSQLPCECVIKEKHFQLKNITKPEKSKRVLLPLQNIAIMTTCS